MTALRWLAAVVLVLATAALGVAPAGAAAPGRGADEGREPAPSAANRGGSGHGERPRGAPREQSDERPGGASSGGRETDHRGGSGPERRDEGTAPAPRHERRPAAASGRAEPAAQPQGQPSPARGDARPDRRGQEQASGRQQGPAPQQGGRRDHGPGDQPDPRHGHQHASRGDHRPDQGQQHGRGDGQRPGSAETAAPTSEAPFAAAGAVHVNGVSLGFEVIAVSGGSSPKAPDGRVRAASAGRSPAMRGRPGPLVDALPVVPVADVADAGPVVAEQPAPRRWPDQILEPVVRVPLALAAEPAFPVVLGIAIAAFLVLFGRGDRRDPKLTAAAIGGRRDRSRFS